VFSLRIFGSNGCVAIQGQSEPGETWDATLLRLHRQTVMDSDHRILDRPDSGSFRDLLTRGTGKGVAVVLRQSEPPQRPTHLKEYVRFETDPPQF
jgi:hypothetical protein